MSSNSNYGTSNGTDGSYCHEPFDCIKETNVELYESLRQKLSAPKVNQALEAELANLQKNIDDSMNVESIRQTDKSRSNTDGYFYLVQLIPEVLPERIKLGYTSNMDKTIFDIRESAPTAIIIKKWHCKPRWTQAAVDALTSVDCVRVLNDIFEGDLLSFMQIGDQFFQSMPQVEREIPLSEHSPLKVNKHATEQDEFRKILGALV